MRRIRVLRERGVPVNVIALTVVFAIVFISACGDTTASSGVGGTSGSGGAGGVGGFGAGGEMGSTSSGGPMCDQGGAPCETFDACCSGTCADKICTSCANDGANCSSEQCCLGLTCYASMCRYCSDNGEQCQSSDDCCSGICSLGICDPPACGNLTNCNNVCTATLSDKANCGACGNVCDVDYACCSGACTYIAGGQLNCGGCGLVCDSSIGNFCENGTCVAHPDCCLSGTNVGQPITVGIPTPDVFVAWEFIPTCGMTVTSVELFTYDGELHIREDNGGVPGVSSAWSGTIVPVDPPAWTATFPMASKQLDANKKYWIVHQTTTFPNVTSVADTGTPMAAISSSFSSGPWQALPNLPYMVHVNGNCVVP